MNPEEKITRDVKTLEEYFDATACVLTPCGSGTAMVVCINGHPTADSAAFEMSPTEIADHAEEIEREEPGTDVTVRIRNKQTGTEETVTPVEFSSRLIR